MTNKVSPLERCISLLAEMADSCDNVRKKGSGPSHGSLNNIEIYAKMIKANYDNTTVRIHPDRNPKLYKIFGNNPVHVDKLVDYLMDQAEGKSKK